MSVKEKVSEVEYPWTAATLFAARKATKLTQEQLADLAGIDRSRYNGLENGKQKLTRYYAEKLAAYVNKAADELLQPAEAAVDPLDPLVLLRRLGETVEKQQKTISSLQARVEGLEQAASKRRPARGGER